MRSSTGSTKGCVDGVLMGNDYVVEVLVVHKTVWSKVLMGHRTV